MELSQHLVKKGELDKLAIDPDACLASVLETYSDPSWDPITFFLNADNAQLAAPILKEMHKTEAKTRRLVKTVIDYFLEGPENFAKSESKMCSELNIPYYNWYSQSRRCPAIWRFINLVVVGTANLVGEGRAHMAALNNALQGGHQDLRLWFELTKKISRAGAVGKAGGVNIIFVQDSMQRPEGSGQGDTTIITLDSTPSKTEESVKQVRDDD